MRPTQHCRQPTAKSPHTKSPTAAGMRQCKRSQQLKEEKSEVKFSIEKQTSRKRKEHRNKIQHREADKPQKKRASK
jgi:hypothetical protein